MDSSHTLKCYEHRVYCECRHLVLFNFSTATIVNTLLFILYC